MKQNLRAAAVFSACMVFFLLVASTVYSSLLEHEDLHQYLADALDEQVSPTDNVIWTSLAPKDGTRVLSEGEKTLIGRALGRAWQRLSFAQSVGNPDLLIDAFSGPALTRAKIATRDAAQSGGRIAFLAQTATPVFFHQDGSVFQAELDLLVARFFVTDGKIKHIPISRDKAIVTLLNETTGWKVYSFHLTDIQPLSNQSKDVDLPVLRGVNYYPANTPWTQFWTEYDPETIEKDFRLIQSIGANSVRFFLDYGVFSATETRAMATSNLRDFLRIAEKYNITLVPTLFDLKRDYRPGYWEQDTRYLETVLPLLAASPMVRLLDIKNEPDLDYTAHGQGLVDNWLVTMLSISGHRQPDLPVTIGWSNAIAAENLMQNVDVVTYHAYEDLEKQPYVFAELKSKTGRKRVMITEIGETSFNLGVGFPANPNRQARRLGKRLAALSVADGIFVWTLHDFPNVDAGAVGRSIWVQNLQSKFGLYDLDGKPKPAAQTVRRAFGNLVLSYPNE